MDNNNVITNRNIGLENMDEDTIDLVEMFWMLIMHWKSIFLALLAGAVIAGAYHTFLVKPSFEADAEIYITNTDSMISFSDLQLSAALTDDYANIIKSRNVLKKVIKELQLDTDYKSLSRLVHVETPSQTHIVKISVTCDDLELARDIANCILNISVEQIYQIIGSGVPTIIDISEADAVEEVTPGLMKYLAVGALIGAFLVCAVVILTWMMDTTLKTEEDIEKYLGMPVLSSVPYYSEK